jgi:hypothetical protein
MKKYLIPIIIFCVAGAGVFIRYIIVSPARALARDLVAINGITVGQTTEADLLGRSAFQTLDRSCFGTDCQYNVVRTNSFLSRLHLAPHTFFGTTVWVRDGMVMNVSVFVGQYGLEPLLIAQTMKLPAECASNPCVKQSTLPKLAGTSILFNNESELRNRMPEAAQSACLSRLHGCKTYDELMPLSRGLNLEAIGH